ncbi:MAG TPA: hypothetical protein VNZ26_07685 [Vicinamibacterales bacterium]|jgi:hypothetical protein|nr:hypothetical protein [Vicinamibacterales bacterium]
MTLHRLFCALLLGLIAASQPACSSSSSSPASPSTPVVRKAGLAIEALTATVQPITSPGNGWLYRLTYHVHETGGTTGATLVTQHFSLSDGESADGNFNGPGVLQTPRVAAGGTITVESDLSVLTTRGTATHVVFTVGFTDDNGQTGSAGSDADISTTGM